MHNTIKIFLSYSHKDKVLKDLFVKHLYSLIRLDDKITLWSDEDILGGHKWDSEINNHLMNADLILLLISPDFIRSDYCYNKELKQAIELHNQRKAVVVPVGLRSTFIDGQPFCELQMLPTNPQFVDSWQNSDEAFKNIIEGLNKTLYGVVAEIKNWNPFFRRDEINDLVANRRYEDACDKLLQFICDFSTDKTLKLKDRVSIMKANFCDIIEDKHAVDYKIIYNIKQELLSEIYSICDVVEGQIIQDQNLNQAA